MKYRLLVLPAVIFHCMILTGSAHAVRLPLPGTADPLGLAACYAGQDQGECGLLDLKGNVKRVTVMVQFTTNKPFTEYLIDTAGRVIEMRRHLQDMFGGINSRKLFYDEQGRVVQVTFNDKETEKYEYKGKYLIRATRFGEPTMYDVQETGTEGVRITLSTPKAVTNYSVDTKGRLVDAAENFGQVINFGGVHFGTHCSYAANGAGGLDVNCVSGRPIARTFDSAGRQLTDGKYSFKFDEDSHGNWIVRETKPEERSWRRVRAIEYY